MNNTVDLLVIGGGPAGLMTAKRAAELGLKAAVIELKNDISKVGRACSAQFVTDEGYENETVKVEGNKIIFTKNNFSINSTGHLLNITDSFHISPDGHKIHLAHNDHRPFAVKFEKGRLLSDLYNDCRNLGVEIMLSTIAYGGRDLGNYVRLDIKKDRTTSSILGRKLVIAEGANAKLTGFFGLNKGRRIYGTPLVFSAVIKGVSGFEPQSWNQLYGKKYHPFSEVIVESAVEGSDTVEVTIMGTKNLKPYNLFEKFIKESPMSRCFAHSQIIEKRGCYLKSYSSLLKPYKGNILAIGDSSAHVEVIVQGALMCGYHAAQAVYDELNNKNGFEDYTKWWDDAFDFNRSNPLDFVKLYGRLNMSQNYTDEELDYLFALIEDHTLSGNFSQFEVPKTIWKTILSCRSKIEKEKPDLFIKIQNIIMLYNAGKLN